MGTERRAHGVRRRCSPELSRTLWTRLGPAPAARTSSPLPPRPPAAPAAAADACVARPARRVDRLERPTGLMFAMSAMPTGGEGEGIRGEGGPAGREQAGHPRHGCAPPAAWVPPPRTAGRGCSALAPMPNPSRPRHHMRPLRAVDKDVLRINVQKSEEKKEDKVGGWPMRGRSGGQGRRAAVGRAANVRVPRLPPLPLLRRPPLWLLPTPSRRRRSRAGSGTATSAPASSWAGECRCWGRRGRAGGRQAAAAPRSPAALPCPSPGCCRLPPLPPCPLLQRPAHARKRRHGRHPRALRGGCGRPSGSQQPAARAAGCTACVVLCGGRAVVARRCRGARLALVCSPPAHLACLTAPCCSPLDLLPPTPLLLRRTACWR